MVPHLSALVFDLDGTAIPTGIDSRSSGRVIAAVRQARRHMFVSVATGRTLIHCRHILDAFGIDRPCILCGGTQLMNPNTGEVLWEEPLKPQAVEQIFRLLAPFGNLPICSNHESVREAVPISAYTPPDRANIFYLLAVPEAIVPAIRESLKAVEGIQTHALASWTPGLWDIHIHDELATKKHAMQVLLAKEGLSHTEVMVVGDGSNDLPLFSLAGWKVAMGNASDKLKEVADWIAPPVTEDGLAVAIDRFILSQ